MRELRTATIAIVLLSVLLGLAYPLAMTGVAQTLFGTKADGDTTLLARAWHPADRYFQPRPSQTGYSTTATAFSNRGPNSKEARAFFRARIDVYRQRERLRADENVPVDAVTTSASGVDPHISQANAAIQARRVATVRRLSLKRVLALVADNTDGRFLGLLGEPGVNTTKLNEALDDDA